MNTPGPITINLPDAESARLAIHEALAKWHLAWLALDAEPDSVALHHAEANAFISTYAYFSAMRRENLPTVLDPYLVDDWKPEINTDAPIAWQIVKDLMFVEIDGVTCSPMPGDFEQAWLDYFFGPHGIKRMLPLALVARYCTGLMLAAGHTHHPDLAEIHRARKAAIAAKKLENNAGRITQEDQREHEKTSR